MRPWILAVVPVIFALSLASCGGDDDSDKEDADRPPTSQAADPGDSGDEVRTATAYGEEFPYCADLWVEGQTIPEDYGGCWNDDEESVELAGSVDCADGGKLVDTDFGFGLRGEAVHLRPPGLDDPDANSPEYDAMQSECLG